MPLAAPPEDAAVVAGVRLSRAAACLGRAARWLALVAFVSLLAGAAGAVGPATSSIGGLVAGLEQRVLPLLPAARGAIDVGLVVVPDRTVGSASGLAPLIARLLIARLGSRGFRSSALLRPAASDQYLAAARASGIDLVLVVRIFASNGHLYLGADLRDTGASLWRDLLHPSRGSRGYVSHRVRLDGEVRAFFRPSVPVPLRFSAHRFRLESGARLLALGAGDLDGDGQPELIALTVDRVETFALRGGHWQRRERIGLPGPLAAMASRREHGTLLIEPKTEKRPARIFARSSAESRAVVLSFERGRWQVSAACPGFPLLWPPSRGDPLCLETTPGTDYFAARSGARLLAAQLRSGQRSLGPSGLPFDFYTVRGATVAARGGTKRFVAAVDTQGRFRLFGGVRGEVVYERAGVGVACDLVDIDDDGEVDLVLSGGDEDATEERVTIMSLRRGAAKTLWRSGLFSGKVRALTYGDFDGDGKLELVAGYCEGARCELVLFD